MSGTCEAGWRASSPVGSSPAGCGSALQHHAPHCGDVESGGCDVGREAPPCCLVGDSGRLAATGVELVRLKDPPGYVQPDALKC